MNDWTWGDLSIAWERTRSADLEVAAGLFLPIMIVTRLVGRLTAVRRRSWGRDLGLAFLVALPWTLLFAGGHTWREVELLNACQTGNATYVTSPDGRNRLVVYSFDCSPTDRLFMVSMLKPGETLPRYNSAAINYEGPGTPHAAGDEANFKAFWTGATLVTVEISGYDDRDRDLESSYGGEGVTVVLKKLTQP